MNIKNKLKYLFSKFEFLKIYNSPFKPLKIEFYIGKLRYGTPIFYPRKWVKNKDKSGYLKAVDKWIGFDFVGLGYKTKWHETDYRHEWDPIWSFVFFKLQVCLKFHTVSYHEWEAWIYYHYDTDRNLSKRERLKLTKENFPLNFKQYSGGVETDIDYYDLILKKKYICNKQATTKL